MDPETELQVRCGDGHGQDGVPDVSIVVPVYNTARYVEGCLRSILGQEGFRLEIIAVDDASTDGSRAAIASVAAGERRIRLIELAENVGQGFARNRAIKAARGEYVAFLDSDDSMAPDSLGRLLAVALADRADIVFGAIERYREQSNGARHLLERLTPPFDRPIHGTDIVRHPGLARLGACWQGIYRRDFLLANDLAFRRRHYEDFDFLLNCIVRAKSISVAPEIIYVRNLSRLVACDGDRSTTQHPLTPADADLLLDHFKAIDAILRNGEGPDAVGRLREPRRIVMQRYGHRFALEILPAVAAFAGQAERHAYYDAVAAIFGQNTGIEEPRPPSLERAAGAAGDKVDLILALLLARQHPALDEILIHGGLSETVIAQILLSRPAFEERLFGIIERIPAVVLPRARSIPAIVPRGVGRTILHIGMPKTGSTYIQNFLERNRAQLLAQGVIYATTGIFREEGARNLRTSGHQSLLAGLKGMNEELLLAYRREIEAAGKVDTVIFSAEDLFCASTPALVDGLAKALANGDTKIAVYLRRQDEWIESMYVESVTGSHWRTSVSFEEYLYEKEKAGWLDYASILGIWRNRFGADGMLVRPFESGRLHGSPARDFLELCSIGEAPGLVEPDAKSANRFFGDRIDVEVIRFFNRLPFRDRTHYVAFLGQYHSWSMSRGGSPGRPVFLALADRSRLLARYADINASIARDYLGREDGILFENGVVEAIPEDVQIPAGTLDHAYACYHNAGVAAGRPAAVLTAKPAATAATDPTPKDQPFRFETPRGVYSLGLTRALARRLAIGAGHLSPVGAWPPLPDARAHPLLRHRWIKRKLRSFAKLTGQYPLVD
jgi:glycosyltransferase involved in cell wall biosynthesis